MSLRRGDAPAILRLGIGSYAFAWAAGVPGYPAPARRLDPLGLVRKASDLGVSLVQICDNLPLHGRSDGELRALAEAAAAAGVTVEVGTRGTHPEHLGCYLEIAGALEAPLVRTLVTGSLARAETELSAALPDYEKAGVLLALENYEAHPCAELAALVRRVGSPCLGVCLDTVNSLGALEPPARVFETLLPLAFSVHLKDFTIDRKDHRMGFEIAGTPAGDGLLDIATLIAELKIRRPAASVVIELWPPFRGDIEKTVRLEAEWARRSVDNLRRYFP